MKHVQENNGIRYQPILFTICTFMITWGCAGLMTEIDYNAHRILFVVLDFMENASPLFCALVLFRPYLTEENFLFRFFFGASKKNAPYIVVFALFVAQFLNFYLFKVEDYEFSIRAFVIAFAGQFLLGGGLEEGGWRGYLLPCLYKRFHILFSSTAVSIVWVLWHLPYFFVSGSMQAEGSFLSYFLIGIITGWILAAIYLLTNSVLLCMLFHSWQNTIVMTVQADSSNVGFVILFVLLGVTSALLCIVKQKQDKL